MMQYFQRLGKSLMLPVAVLPAAAILMGIGYWIDPTGWGGGNIVSAFLIKAGSAIIDHMSILFAVGISLGMTKSKDGAAALAGLVAFLIVTTLLGSNAVALFKGIDVANVDPAFGKIENQFIGIISGIIAAETFNKFSGVQLPAVLAFFSGKRCVPILTSVFMILLSAVLFFIWPVIFRGLVTFGTAISNMGPIGAGIYGFLNRLLIPTGLHHALNSVFWFDVADIDDIGKFLGTKPGAIKGVTGMYQAGFFPVMMFGVPAIGLAMYHTSRPEKKKETASLVIAAGFSAFFTGVTEPMEFSFMFLAPLLYLAHCILAGISLFIAAAFHWTAGFGFSAGLVDFVLSLRNPNANNPLMLMVQGLVFAGIYYIVARTMITVMDLKTPGREEDDPEAEKAEGLSDNDFTRIAAIVLEGLGGKDNVVNVDNCITRLRLEIKDMSIVNDKKIKSAGISGIIKPGPKSIQIIVGTKVQFVADELRKMV